MRIQKTLLIIVSLLVFGCNKNVENLNTPILSDFDKEVLSNLIFEPDVNIFKNENLNIRFSGNSVNSNELNYIETEVVNKQMDIQISNLTGVTFYFENFTSLDSNVKIQRDDIIAISVYNIGNKGDMYHSLFIKNSQGEYIKEISLKESLMSTTNQTFLLSMYFPDSYTVKPMGINTIRDYSIDREKILKQRNEFDLFRVTNTFKGLNLNINNARQFQRTLDFIAADCSGSPCEDGGSATCDAGLYCENAGCSERTARDETITRGIVSESVASALFDLDLHRNLRENLMTQYSIGDKYIEYYNAISGYVLSSDYETSTILKMISSLPNLNTAIDKLMSSDSSLDGEIIIDEALRGELFSIIDDLKDISDNQDYRTILEELENDLNFISNKSKGTVINSLY